MLFAISILSCSCCNNKETYSYHYLIKVHYLDDTVDTIQFNVDNALWKEGADFDLETDKRNNTSCLVVYVEVCAQRGSTLISRNLACYVKHYEIISR